MVEVWSRRGLGSVGIQDGDFKKSQLDKILATLTCYKEPEAPCGFPMGPRECMCGLPLRWCLGSGDGGCGI